MLGSPASATATITDNDSALPAVSVAVSNGAEGGASPVVTFTRTGSTASSLAVTVARTGTSVAADVTGPTVAGGSFNGTTTVTFAAGSSTVTLTYGVVDDSLVEGAETLIFTVQSGSGYTVGSPSSATSTITDNDVAPTLAITDVTVTEGNNGGAGRHRDADRDAHRRLCRATSTVNWTTLAGTAVAGSDFTAASGTLTFTAGQATKTITITIVGDKKAESTETFSVVLTVPTGGNATFGDNTGVVTILDNDGALLTSSAPAIPAAGAALDPTVVPAMRDRAIREWIAAGASPTALAGITFAVADLPGLKLAETLGNTITIDIDAAGWGWHIDPASAVPTDRIDLLSVLLHEIGHALGFEHAAAGLMEGSITTGTRLTLGPSLMAPSGIAEHGLGAELDAQLRSADMSVATIRTTLPSVDPRPAPAAVGAAAARILAPFGLGCMDCTECGG